MYSRMIWLSMFLEAGVKNYIIIGYPHCNHLHPCLYIVKFVLSPYHFASKGHAMLSVFLHYVD